MNIVTLYGLENGDIPVIPSGTIELSIKESIDLTRFDIVLPKSLIKLTVSTTKIRHFDYKLFKNLPNLEELNLFNNYLESFDYPIGNKLTCINLASNMLTGLNIPDTKILEQVNLSLNKFTTVPECFVGKDIIVNYAYNNFESVDIQYFINKNVRKPDQEELIFSNRNCVPPPSYGLSAPAYPVPPEHTTQNLVDAYKTAIRLNNNVHQTPIQRNTCLAINKLMELDLKVLTQEETFTTIKNYYKERRNSFTNIRKWIFGCPLIRELDYLKTSEYKFEYDWKKGYKIGYPRLFQLVLAYIQTQDPPTILGIMKSLKFQILDGIDFCQVGKITRIVGSLTSFTDIMVYERSITQIVSEEAIRIKHVHKGLGEESEDYINICMLELKEFLNGMNMAEEEQLVWLDSF